MKCLRKYQWVKLPRDIPDMGKGLMAYWAMLAFRAAFRKGNASYCGHSNPVAPGMWAGGVVGLKSILGVRSRTKALQILGELSSLGFLKYSLDSQTKKLTYEITDWVVKCSGAECMSGTVYASTGYGFLYAPDAGIPASGNANHRRPYQYDRSFRGWQIGFCGYVQRLSV